MATPRGKHQGLDAAVLLGIHIGVCGDKRLDLGQIAGIGRFDEIALRGICRCADQKAQRNQPCQAVKGSS